MNYETLAEARNANPKEFDSAIITAVKEAAKVLTPVQLATSLQPKSVN